MTRTFIAALVGASIVGAAGANAMLVDASNVSQIVSEKASMLSLSKDDIANVSVLTNWDGSGQPHGYTAWVSLKSGGVVVVEVDDNGSAVRKYTR